MRWKQHDRVRKFRLGSGRGRLIRQGLERTIRDVLFKVTKVGRQQGDQVGMG